MMTQSATNSSLTRDYHLVYVKFSLSLSLSPPPPFHVAIYTLVFSQSTPCTMVSTWNERSPSLCVYNGQGGCFKCVSNMTLWYGDTCTS